MDLLEGVVHGNMIELDSALGLPDGQRVSVVIRPMPREDASNGDEAAREESLRDAFGAWADDAEGLDEYLEWSRQQRKIGRPEIEP